MDLADVRDFLTQRSVTWTEKEIPYGTQVRCKGGEMVSVFTSGKVTVQGRATALRGELDSWVKADAGEAAPLVLSGGAASPAVGPSKQVFVVYGHDTQSRKDLELLLLRMGMKPVVLANLTPGGDTIIEKLEKSLIENPQVRFACVLLTPDDQGHPVDEPERIQYRARQNVVLELGMVLAHLGRSRVAIFHKETVELPSDINGVLYIAFKERVDEQAAMLFRVLSEAGYSPDRDAL